MAEEIKFWKSGEDGGVDLGKRKSMKHMVGGAAAVTMATPTGKALASVAQGIGNTDTGDDNIETPLQERERFGPIERTPEQNSIIMDYAKVLATLPSSEFHNKIRSNRESVVVDDFIGNITWPVPRDLNVLFGPRRTGFIAIPEFDVGLLFNGGLSPNIVPIVTGSDTHPTPRNMFRVYRGEGQDYSSDEYQPADGAPANMPFATFFYGRGMAIHGSPACFAVNAQGQIVTSGTSHGCIGVPYLPDTNSLGAKEIQEVLYKPGELLAPVLIMPKLSNIREVMRAEAEQAENNSQSQEPQNDSGIHNPNHEDNGAGSTTQRNGDTSSPYKQHLPDNGISQRSEPDVYDGVIKSKGKGK